VKALRLRLQGMTVQQLQGFAAGLAPESPGSKGGSAQQLLAAALLEKAAQVRRP
jgi:hypothetical protein